MERANTRETSALIKRYIKEKYNVCAKVRTSKYSGGDSLDIEYTAGPDEGIIKPLFNNLQEGDFDGMRDLYEYKRAEDHGLTLYGKQLETRKYVFVRQEIPENLRFQLARCYSQTFNFADLPEVVSPEDLNRQFSADQFSACGECWNWSNLIYRRFKVRNFCTDQADKIKILSCEDPNNAVFTYEYEGKQYKTNKFELPGKPAKAAKPDPEPVKAGNIKIIEYSEKALAVIGDTRPIKDTLKQLGGRFNPRLSCGPGWIFSKKRETELKAYFN